MNWEKLFKVNNLFQGIRGDVTRWDGKKVSNKQIPTKVLYKEFLNNLIDEGEISSIIVARLAAEAGCRRMEIAEARIENLNFKHLRGLWLDKTKRIRGRRAKKSIIMKREVALNSELYEFILKNVDMDMDKQKYIVPRIRGNINKPFSYRYIFYLLEKFNPQFNINHLRHYFKSMVWSWMIQSKQPDPGVLKELMGHTKTVHESYGKYTWEYKLSIIDSVFCERPIQPDLQEAIVKAIKNGFDSVQPKNKSKMWKGNCPICQAAITAPIFVKHVKCPSCHRLLDVINSKNLYNI